MPAPQNYQLQCFRKYALSAELSGQLCEAEYLSGSYAYTSLIISPAGTARQSHVATGGGERGMRTLESPGLAGLTVKTRYAAEGRLPGT